MSNIQTQLEEVIDRMVNERMQTFLSELPKPQSRNQLLTIQQAAERLRVSIRTIQNYFNRGVLTRINIGHQVRISQDEIDNIVNQQIKN